MRPVTWVPGTISHQRTSVRLTQALTMQVLPLTTSQRRARRTRTRSARPPHRPPVHLRRLLAPLPPPVVVVRGGSSVRPTLVERARRGPGQHRGASNWREHVRVVPGGHGPGRPDMEQRDRARVLLPVHGPRLDRGTRLHGRCRPDGDDADDRRRSGQPAQRAGRGARPQPGPDFSHRPDPHVPAATVRGLLAGRPPSGGRRRGHLDLIAHDSAATGEPASPIRTTPGFSRC